ncbi:MAG: universal stress protein [Solirubrobacteraceae bacterium]
MPASPGAWPGLRPLPIETIATPGWSRLDGSWESRLALTAAAGLADALAGELRVISVLKRPSAAHPMFAFTSYHRHLDELEAERRTSVIDATDALHVHPEVDPVVVDGEPPDVLADLSSELGLLVMGSRGYGPCAGCSSAASRTRCWNTPAVR